MFGSAKYLILVVAAAALCACGDECDEAVQLCQECELITENCEGTYAEASADECAAAVSAYEASCPE